MSSGEGSWLPLERMSPPTVPSPVCLSTPEHPTGTEGLSYIIPLGFGLLLLEPAIFPTVQQLHQEPPDDQNQNTNEEHTSNGAAHDQGDIGGLWALCGTDRQCWAAAPGEAAWLAACLWQGRRSRNGIPLSGLTMTVYISSPSSWIIRKDIQQSWESFSLHFLSFVLTSAEFMDTLMLGQAWEQFFSKGPLLKNLHSTQELQNKQPQPTSAGPETLLPGLGYSWALPKHRQGQIPGILAAPVPSLSASLTCIDRRVRDRLGTPGRRGAGTFPSTGSGCSGRSHGGCTRVPGCAGGSPPSIAGTGRRCPRIQDGTCTSRSHTAHVLQRKILQILQPARQPSLCPCLESITHPSPSTPPSVGCSRRSYRLVRWDAAAPNPPTGLWHRKAVSPWALTLLAEELCWVHHLGRRRGSR